MAIVTPHVMHFITKYIYFPNIQTIPLILFALVLLCINRRCSMVNIDFKILKQIKMASKSLVLFHFKNIHESASDSYKVICKHCNMFISVLYV